MWLTIPGTETNVTPEIDAPIIPNATIYHGERLFAKKKVALVARRAVILLTKNKIEK